MSSVLFGGFLPDEDSFCLARSIRRYRVMTYEDVGLARGASDEKVAEHARRHGAIVMTRNWRDFKKVMEHFAALSSRGDCKAMNCHEGGGFVSVHPSMTSFHFERVTRQLALGSHAIGWGDCLRFESAGAYIPKRSGARVVPTQMNDACVMVASVRFAVSCGFRNCTPRSRAVSQ